MATKAKKSAVSPSRKKTHAKSARQSIIEDEITAKLSVGVRELRQDASKVLKLVKGGETILVTERGKPVAEIRPIKEITMQDLIDAGIVTPAKAKFDPKVFEPLPNPEGRSLLKEFLKERREARY
jgi:prevent-host-death family protein